MSKEDAIKEYLHALETNPGYIQSARKSFRKSREVKERLEKEIGEKYGVDPVILRNAELEQRALILAKAGGWMSTVSGYRSV